MDDKKLLEKITRLANRYDLFGLYSKADTLDKVAQQIIVESAKKSRPTTGFIFPPTEEDNKGRYPIPDLSHGRLAIASVNKYDKLPAWAKKRGFKDLQSLVNKVVSSVTSAFPSINVSEAASKPGKG